MEVGGKQDSIYAILTYRQLFNFLFYYTKAWGLVPELPQISFVKENNSVILSISFPHL